MITSSKTTKADTVIELANIKKSYLNGGVETAVLHGIDLTIKRGEFLSIMGPSGSGKSTLMHLLGFLDKPTSGDYLFLGKKTEYSDDDALAEIRSERVSFVFQSFNLLPRTTVLQNVIVPMLYNPLIPKNQREKRALSAIATVGLSDRATYLTSQLSGGQQQRVAIARSLVTDPDIIFADEPTGNLDSASGIGVLQALQTLHRDGHTIILVTHELTTAQHAERIIHLRDGRIESDSRDFKRLIAGSESLLK